MQRWHPPIAAVAAIAGLLTGFLFGREVRNSTPPVPPARTLAASPPAATTPPSATAPAATTGTTQGAAPQLPPLRLPVVVSARGKPRVLEAGTTLGEAVRRLGLTPRAGRLLDVEGVPLDEDAFPGKVLLNGEVASGRARLAMGDRITVVDGRDRREPLARRTASVPAGELPDPQVSLARGPGRLVLAEGTRSGKIADATFYPDGPDQVPREVALTFDDGPWPGTTRQVLEILRRERVPATFFLVGQQARRHPELVREIQAAGHTVATHSEAHPKHLAGMPLERAAEEIRAGKQALEALGVTPAHFRPPGGSTSQALVEAARRQGLRTVLWDVDPRDWERGSTPEGITRKVLDAARPGSVILLHDGGGDRSATVAALPGIIEGLREKGLGFTAL